ncbi:MAG: gfo/Idh/MocA family oxidoreductase, partial [Bacteroidota bacterium]|nr:gfo/Idh/MocA family oxidoreductase [Bacteroidota bacterium]
NFIDAVKSRNAASLNAPIQVGYNAALISLLGNVAYKTGRKIHWDDNKKQFEEKEANEFLKANYHNNWKVPNYKNI